MSEKSFYFKVLAVPTLIYAFLYTLFLYDNMSSYTMFLFSFVTLGFIRYCLKAINLTWKPSGNLYMVAILLLSASDFFTGNSQIILMNNLAVFSLVILMLLNQLYDTSAWSLRKAIGSFFMAIFGAIGTIPAPFEDLADRRTEMAMEGQKTSKFIYVLIGLLITIPLLLVILPLLSFADAVFADAIAQLLNKFNIFDAVCTTLLFIFAFFSSYCGIRYLFKRSLPVKDEDRRHFEPTIAIVSLSIIAVLYLFFSGIQVFGLFLGKIGLPDGYTYSSYAREGFFQLLFVCALNLILVLVFLDFFRPHLAVKILLTVIAGCTYIMLASSAYRMCLYIYYYHLTQLRVSVLWALALLALLMAGVICHIYKNDFKLFRYFLAVGVGCYLILSFSHMDYWIARYNVSHTDDSSYISELSTDAMPVIAEFMDSAPDLTYSQQCDFDNYMYMADYRTDDNWWHLNLSHLLARRYL